MSRDWDDLADELGTRAVADGQPTRWYDELWSAAGRGEVPLPWDHTDPNPVLSDWLTRWRPDGPAGRAVVVGCGLGADSEFLSGRGWQTTAFDISPAAVAAVRERYPDSDVDYREGNLLDLTGDSADLVGAFDLVVEIFTLQALHPSLREEAVAGVRSLLAPGGTALVVQVVRRDDQPRSTEPPWTLTRAEMEAVAGGGVAFESLGEVRPEGRVNPLWQLVLRRR